MRRRPRLVSRHAAALWLVTAGLAAPAVWSAEFCVSCAAPEAHYACVTGSAASGADDSMLKLLCISELAKSGGHGQCAIDRATAPPCQGERKTVGDVDGSSDVQPPQAAGTAAASKGGPAPGPAPNPSSSGRPAVQQPVQSPERASGQTSGQTSGQPSGQASGAASWPSSGPQVAPPSASAASQPAAKPVEDGPPKTVEGVIKKGAASAGTTLEQTGEKASEAAGSVGGALGKAGDSIGAAAKKSWKCLSSLFSDC